MCGRYYIDDDTADEIEELLDEIDRELNGRAGGRSAGTRPRFPRVIGDICPSDRAAVIAKTPTGFGADVKRWGFRSWDGKGLVINARSETAMEKPMFQESIRCRRCVIPASGFYEWNREKEKFTFFLPEKRPMYFAGVYRRFQNEEEDRYVILTTGANASMEPVHSRMPLILGREDAKLWLKDEGAAGRLLAKEPEALRREAGYEQMRLSFPE